MTSGKKPEPEPSDGFLRSGGALRGELWQEQSAERADPAAITSSATGAPRASPAQIGAYRVLRPLGSGGQADVLLAYDARLERHVAIKRTRAGRRLSARARERLRREAAAAATINHPAVVQIYDILDEPEGAAIVMEYVEGRTLAQALAAGALDAVQAIGIARQVAEGLAAAHAVGLLHRDLKTQNVVVTPSGQAKILDFGLAKRLTPREGEDALTSDGMVLGTTRAMSPEQAQGRPLDASSDLFSLGVMLYEICAGESPFQGLDPLETMNKVIGEAPAPLRERNPGVPEPLAALDEELLEKEPARRPPSAAAVAERLRQVEALPALPAMRLPVPQPPAAPATPSGETPSLPTRSGPSGRPSDRARRWMRHWPWLAALAITTALAAALALREWRGVVTARRPLVVLVLEPKVDALTADDDARLAAFGVREAALHVLAGFEGVEAVGPEDLVDTSVSVPEAARAVAADEVVTSAIACSGQWCRISMRRQRGGDGRMVSDSGSFDASIAPEDSLALAHAVAIHLPQAYPGHALRPGQAPREASSADYQRYLRLALRNNRGEVLGAPEIDELLQVARSSPGLVEADLLAAGIARKRSDPRLEQILRDAEERYPADPRFVFERLVFLLKIGSVARAEAALHDLERRTPGDVRVWRARALLASQQGRLQEAAEAYSRIVTLRPSWQNLLYLANVELSLADAASARRHLEQLLAVSPRNPHGLAKLAEVEWVLGDPAAAARIYQDLLSRTVTQESLGNLGWSLLLAGDYPGAVAAYMRAREHNRGHLLSWLNLGIALEGVGDAPAARRVYRELLEQLAARERTHAPGDTELLTRAQALARLGDSVAAVDITARVLAGGNRDVQVVYRAAVIYAVCGERSNALVHAREARRRGLSPRWFTIPGFESVRAAPEFRELLAPRAAAP